MAHPSREVKELVSFAQRLAGTTHAPPSVALTAQGFPIHPLPSRCSRDAEGLSTPR